MAATECIIQRTAGYTVMSNYHLRDKRLSLKSKGLLSVILSLPEGWDYTISGLAVICDTGRDAIRAAIGELEKAGYITRRQLNQGGKFGGNQYIIREIPTEVQQPLSGFPATVIPPAETPSRENPTEIIKDQSITDLSNPPISPEDGELPKAPKKRGRAKASEAASNTPSDFDLFWSAYPRKVDKKKARAAFAKVRAPVSQLLAALEAQKKTEQWVKDGGRFVPHPTTWLNGERWEDDVTATPAPAPAPALESLGEEW